jgi:hypothetical protein
VSISVRQLNTRGPTTVRLFSQLLFDVGIAYCDSSREVSFDACTDDSGYRVAHFIQGECGEPRRAAAIETATHMEITLETERAGGAT